MNLRRTHIGWGVVALASLAVLAITGFDPMQHLLQLVDPHTAGRVLAEGGAVTISSTVLADQITKFKAKLTECREKMTAIVAKSIEDGRTLDAAEEEERKGLAAEIDAVTKHIAVLEETEKLQVAKATPVQGAGGQAAGQGQGFVQIPGNVISVKRNMPKGSSFTRYAMCLAAGKGNLMQAEVLAKRFGDTPEVEQVIKAAVAAGTTTDATWAGPLVQYNDMVDEFIELLRPQTVLGRLDRVRRVPFNIRIPRQTAGTIGTFVGEGAPAPVRKLDFDNVTLPWAKASTIVVLSAELSRLSNPSAEALVRQDLIDGIAQYLDRRLLDPQYAGVANVSPASLTNGVTARQASGASLEAIDDDTAYVFEQWANAEMGLDGAVWASSPSQAVRLSKIRNSMGVKEYPNLTMNGGEWEGLPLLASNNVAATASPGDQQIIGINQREILLADDNQMMIDVSTEAAVQMNDAPSAGAQSLVSLWQNGLLGVKVDRWIYWMKRRAAAVQIIDGAQRYGS